MITAKSISQQTPEVSELSLNEIAKRYNIVSQRLNTLRRRLDTLDDMAGQIPCILRNKLSPTYSRYVTSRMQNCKEYNQLIYAIEPYRLKIDFGRGFTRDGNVAKVREDSQTVFPFYNELSRRAV